MQLTIDKKLNRFWEIVENDAGLAIELANIFCETVPPQLHEIREDFEQKALKPFCLKVHKLKGTIGYAGFNDELDFIAQLEQNSKINGSFPSSKEMEELEIKINHIVELFNESILSNSLMT